MRNEILQRRFERLYFPRVKKAIKSRISSLIEVINERGVQAGVNYLSTELDSKDLPRVIEDLYLKVGLRFARMQWSELQRQKRLAKKGQGENPISRKAGFISGQPLTLKGFGFNADWVEWIKDYLFRFLLDKIVFRVSETTREVLMNVLNRSIENGWGIKETVKELEDLPLSDTQAARIVRTEITRASNAGSMAAGSTFEFEQNKEWIAARDRRTRGVDPEDHASHIGMDGQIVDYNEAFTDPRNGDKLMFPGDPNAKAESTINCRCSVAVIAKRDLNGRLIPKNG